MKVLFLSRWFPYPADNGSKLRVFNVLRQLARQHEISLVSFAGPKDHVDGGSFRVLRRYCADIAVVPYRAFRPRSFRAIAGFFSIQPRSLVDVYSRQMKTAIEARISKSRPDLVVASQVDMVPYAIELRGLPLLLEELETSSIGAAGSRASHQQLLARLTWLKLAFYLRRALPRFAACTVVSENELARVQSILPSYRSLAVLPNAVDLSDYQIDFGCPQRKTLVFTGSVTYQPNSDAVRYFVGEIYPLILEAVGAVTFRITGDVSGVDPTTLSLSRGVEYTGHLEDIRPLVARSWASVVPIRVGGGTRLKIIESMALGTPVVSTSKGAEGLDVEDGVNILIADEPKQFAARVLELLRSPALRERIAAAGRRLVESKYDWRINGEILGALIDSAAARQVLH